MAHRRSAARSIVKLAPAKDRRSDSPPDRARRARIWLSPLSDGRDLLCDGDAGRPRPLAARGRATTPCSPCAGQKDDEHRRPFSPTRAGSIVTARRAIGTSGAGRRQARILRLASRMTSNGQAMRAQSGPGPRLAPLALHALHDRQHPARRTPGRFEPRPTCPSRRSADSRAPSRTCPACGRTVLAVAAMR